MTILADDPTHMIIHLTLDQPLDKSRDVISERPAWIIQRRDDIPSLEKVEVGVRSIVIDTPKSRVAACTHDEIIVSDVNHHKVL